MAEWRMRMRNRNGGQNMFSKCLAHGMAAIHYSPVESVDLSGFGEDLLPSAWFGLAPAQRGSLKKFAWQVRGGDTIYVAESYPSRLVGMGRVRGVEGYPAYRYLEATPIEDEDGHPWRHVLLVDWEQDFQPIPYPEPWASQVTVLDLSEDEATKLKKLVKVHRKPNTARASAQDSSGHAMPDDPIQRRQLEDCSYTRYTAEAIKSIERKHATLCNAFTSWLSNTLSLSCEVERRNIDLSFALGKERVLVEFKVAYSGDPKPAIREAVGQVLEYNFYPGRVKFDHWILVLDCEPTSGDRQFLSCLQELGMPLSFGWRTKASFAFTPECLLHDASLGVSN